MLFLSACFEYFSDTPYHGFECSRAGTVKSKDPGVEIIKRRERSSLKCGCAFSIRATRKNGHDPVNPKTEVWEITTCKLEHTNGCSPGAAQLMLATQAAGLTTLICILNINYLYVGKKYPLELLKSVHYLVVFCLPSSTRTLLFIRDVSLINVLYFFSYSSLLNMMRFAICSESSGICRIKLPHH
jgi:hypothetical protein